MEKLIELLNEYDSSNGWKETDEGIDNIWKIYEFHSELQIISKKYGFIKWLVENEKIDFSREGDLSNELVNLFGRKLDNTEGVIALLSIQDEPIRFLCEILK